MLCHDRTVSDTEDHTRKRVTLSETLHTTHSPAASNSWVLSADPTPSKLGKERESTLISKKTVLKHSAMMLIRW